MAYNFNMPSFYTGTRTVSNSNGTGATTSHNLTIQNAKSGQAVPHWRKKIQKGHNASSPYSRTKSEFRILARPSGRGLSTSNIYSTMFGSAYAFPAGALPTLTDDPLQNNLLLADLISEVDDTIQAVQALPFVAEFGKTKSMVYNRSNSLFDGTLILAKRTKRLYHRFLGVKNGWRRFTSSASSAFLEWKFGWAPTMHDISDAYEELTLGSKTIDIPVIRVARQWDALGSGRTGDVAGAVRYERVSYRGAARRHNYTVAFKPVVHGSTAGRWGLSPGSIPGAIYEITPWSWLVDYFLNIQAFLTQFQYLGLPLKYGTMSKLYIINVDTYVNPVSHATVVYQIVNGKSNFRTLDFKRTTFSSLPFYVPQLNLAGPFDGARAWNIAALAGMKFKKY